MENKIKLIIWDLDNTLWKGILAEGDSVILDQEIIEKIYFLLDRGIVHSIASKNRHEEALSKLNELGIGNLFIFPKISFSSKGPQVKTIIEQTQLRAQNVLFIDDSEFILKEVEFHNPNIQTLLVDQFKKIDVNNWGKNDPTRERLKQYKILEKKTEDKTSFLEVVNKDDHSFLEQCHIEVDIYPVTIQDPQIDRIIELINRANQLNFTHSKINPEYVDFFVLTEISWGGSFKIIARDIYGDYGLIGYVCVAISSNKLVHFVFSCRILGMRIEAGVLQFLLEKFHLLKIPFSKNKVQDFDKKLEFLKINFKFNVDDLKENKSNQKILLRGSCFSSAISSSLSQHFQIDEEIYTVIEYANLRLLRKNYFENSENQRFQSSFKSMKNELKYSYIINFLESDYLSPFFKLGRNALPMPFCYLFWDIKTYLNSKQIQKHMEGQLKEGFHVLENWGSKSYKSQIANYFLKTFKFLPQQVFDGFCRQFLKILTRIMATRYAGFISEDEFKDNLIWYTNNYSEETKLIYFNLPENINIHLYDDYQNQKIRNRIINLNKIVRKIAENKKNMIVLEMSDIIDNDDVFSSYSHLTREGFVKLSLALKRELLADIT